MTELLTLIGSAGSGKLFGLLGDFLSNRAHEKAEREEREFQRDLAYKGQLHDYMQAINTEEGTERPSLMSKTLCFLYILFGVTACVCCMYCFFTAFGEVSIKDPDTKGSSFSIFGIFNWDFTPRSKIDLSPMGVGYLILHPILFILSMVSTGSRGPKRR